MVDKNKKIKIKNICCIGAGYVGGPTMAVIADRVPDVDVQVVDVNRRRIESWNSVELPIHEIGLREILNRRLGRNLHFSTEIDEAISKADCVFIAVNTPTKEFGIGAGMSADLSFLEMCVRRIAESAQGYTIIVEKSTFPVRTAAIIKEILSAVGVGKTFDVLSNPEFLAEGSAINDLLVPDRVLIGGESIAACQSLVDIYSNWVPKKNIITTNLWSSELAKLVANAFLSQRISSINSISALCEKTGADINEVALAVGADSRIGGKFLKAGPGFGGSCFKKDLLNLMYLCEYYGLPEVGEYWGQVLKINDWQKRRISQIILNAMYNTIMGKGIAVLGFAFKKNTNDVRETPAGTICTDLLSEGARLKIYDPKVTAESVKKTLGENYNESLNVVVVDDLYESFVGVDGILILTDWDCFLEIDWQRVSKRVKQPTWVFDPKNMLDRKIIESVGLKYWCLGGH
jgi:UDPglucose 6-dehydrogenase